MLNPVLAAVSVYEGHRSKEQVASLIIIKLQNSNTQIGLNVTDCFCKMQCKFIRTRLQTFISSLDVSDSTFHHSKELFWQIVSMCIHTNTLTVIYFFSAAI